jgi:hypothetical protein
MMEKPSEIIAFRYLWLCFDDLTDGEIRAIRVMKHERAARTKTPICCCDNTSLEAPTCLAIRKRSSTRSRCA